MPVLPVLEWTPGARWVLTDVSEDYGEVDPAQKSSTGLTPWDVADALMAGDDGAGLWNFIGFIPELKEQEAINELFCRAAYRGKEDCLVELYRRGADVDCKVTRVCYIVGFGTKFKRTMDPLELALTRRHRDCVSFLIAVGAPVSEKHLCRAVASAPLAFNGTKEEEEAEEDLVAILDRVLTSSLCPRFGIDVFLRAIEEAVFSLEYDADSALINRLHVLAKQSIMGDQATSIALFDLVVTSASSPRFERRLYDGAIAHAVKAYGEGSRLAGKLRDWRDGTDLERWLNVIMAAAEDM
ncbi:hypothetical protein HYH03_013602 [Edaphochlamys debaryana]|uniref:Uncharacterized protein n=1 Tax=Edaphochlamys debaryana TaxID=47281 RepID=A0A835XMU2_9CHLO|nr:hypothetical protein HYH03_013602 [Edaphochlamys debaryana]|eukprot:KAG2487757.1 hypothetical protein HYH03_013602 [Edaphochlamys debaryana]